MANGYLLITIILENHFPAIWDTSVATLTNVDLQYLYPQITYLNEKQLSIKIKDTFKVDNDIIISGLRIYDFNSKVYNDSKEILNQKKPSIKIKGPNCTSKLGGNDYFIFSHDFTNPSLHNIPERLNVGELFMEWSGRSSDKIKFDSQSQGIDLQLPDVQLIFENISMH